MVFRRAPSVVCVLAAAIGSSAASAQDMPLVRTLVEQKLIEEMASHDSRDTAWYHEKSVDKQKWTSGKLTGRKVRLASWTEQSKTWFWLEQPDETLSLELTRFAVRDARLHFVVTASAKAGFNVWGRIPKLMRASAGGTALVKFEIEGSTAMAKGGLDDSKITRFAGRLADLRFHNDLAHPFEDLVKDGLNDYIDDKNAKLRKSIEKAIDRVKF